LVVPKQFFEIHGLITLEPDTPQEREVWHPVIVVTNEAARDNIFRKLLLEDGYAKRNGSDMYEDFKKVDPEPMAEAPRERKRKAERIPAHKVEVISATGEVSPPNGRRRRQKVSVAASPRPDGQRASGRRSAGAKTEPEPKRRSRRRRNRSS
jgi:hypothetical protein